MATDEPQCGACNHTPCQCPDSITIVPTYPGEEFPPGTGEYITPGYYGYRS